MSLQAEPRILQSDTYKARIKDRWEGRGSDYDSSDTFHNALALKLVELAAVKQGQNVLDLATGTGMVALPVAQSVGIQGQMTGLDISESMLGEARKKSEAAGLANCKFFQADAETVELPEAAFDVILCSSSILYFQDIPAALRRIYSWLKPGGRFCFNSPQEPCVPATAVFYKLLGDEMGIRLADAAAPLRDPDVVKSVCSESGFKQVSVKESRETIQFTNCSPEVYAKIIWGSVALNAIMTPLDGIVKDDDLESKIMPTYMERVIELAEPWNTASGVENPYTMMWVTAQK